MHKLTDKHTHTDGHTSRNIFTANPILVPKSGEGVEHKRIVNFSFTIGLIPHWNLTDLHVSYM